MFRFPGGRRGWRFFRPMPRPWRRRLMPPYAYRRGCGCLGCLVPFIGVALPLLLALAAVLL